MFVSAWREPTGAGHVVWAYAANRASYPDDVLDRDPTGLRDLVLDRIADWAPALRTLVGDAIHSMTPMAGVGANTALGDAAELTQALAATPDPVAAITAYENTMRAYANDAPRISLHNARSAASPARLPRHAFRTLFRLADNIPPIKRAMFTTP